MGSNHLHCALVAYGRLNKLTEQRTGLETALFGRPFSDCGIPLCYNGLPDDAFVNSLATSI
ncbi:MAG: hypothetical protein EBT20_17920 [Alphaproteobacteria bacterium]|nr:hypothetical protein [Alphaproteobacteria bacterium]